MPADPPVAILNPNRTPIDRKGPSWSSQADFTGLNQALTQTTAILPLPHEIDGREDADLRIALIDTLERTTTAAEVLAIAHQLPRSLLKLAYSAVILGRDDGKPLNKKTVSRLMLILRERACPTLYTEAFTIWQHHFPSDPGTKALGVLCAILEIKRDSKHKVQASPQHLLSDSVDLGGPSAALPRRLVSRLKEHPALLSSIMDQMEIEPDWSFGRVLIIEALASGSTTMFVDQIDRLEAQFGTAAAPLQARILRHFLTLRDLPPMARHRAQAIFHHIAGVPESGHPVWALLGNREKRSFAAWAMQATIGSHCLRQPEKAQFYLRYMGTLKRVEKWDSQTLLMSFGRFLIADDQRYPDQALFYAGATPTPHPGGLASPDRSISPASPAISHRQVEEILRRGVVEGIVQLHFDPEGIKQAGVLLEMALHQHAPAHFLTRRRPSSTNLVRPID
jgi:hypothetical protein